MATNNILAILSLEDRYCYSFIFDDIFLYIGSIPHTYKLAIGMYNYGACHQGDVYLTGKAIWYVKMSDIHVCLKPYYMCLNNTNALKRQSG